MYSGSRPVEDLAHVKSGVSVATVVLRWYQSGGSFQAFIRTTIGKTAEQ